ncbi:MAG: major capsid protein [Proteobacteria bacterium]|nr:major capsid protein [Pseudomonadota bacterium]
MQINIRQYFTPAAVSLHLEALPVLETFIMDLIYTNRITHPLPVLGVDELLSITGNVPVVRRGTAAYPLSGESKGITYLEPQPIDVSSFLGAVDLNNLKLLGDQGIEYWVRGKVDTQRRAVRSTTEAMACQSLSGTIAYPMKTESGLDTYTVNFGSILSKTITVKWNHADKTLADILLDLIGLGNVIKRASGYGSRIVYLAGQDVYIAAANKILAVQDAKINAQVTEKGITIAGFTIMLATGGYKDLANAGAWVPSVADDKIVAVAVDAPFKLFYCALDDLDANLLPMPFFSKPVKMDNPSGYNIIGMSKPVPVPVPKAICAGTAI